MSIFDLEDVGDNRIGGDTFDEIFSSYLERNFVFTAKFIYKVTVKVAFVVFP